MRPEVAVEEMGCQESPLYGPQGVHAVIPKGGEVQRRGMSLLPCERRVRNAGGRFVPEKIRE